MPELGVSAAFLWLWMLSLLTRVPRALIITQDLGIVWSHPQLSAPINSTNGFYCFLFICSVFSEGFLHMPPSQLLTKGSVFGCLLPWTAPCVFGGLAHSLSVFVSFGVFCPRLLSLNQLSSLPKSNTITIGEMYLIRAFFFSCLEGETTSLPISFVALCLQLLAACNTALFRAIFSELFTSTQKLLCQRWEFPLDQWFPYLRYELSKCR